jgi:hypothetical protein
MHGELGVRTPGLTVADERQPLFSMMTCVHAGLFLLPRSYSAHTLYFISYAHSLLCNIAESRPLLSVPSL